jgi:hypothetical protein
MTHSSRKNYKEKLLEFQRQSSSVNLSAKVNSVFDKLDTSLSLAAEDNNKLRLLIESKKPEIEHAVSVCNDYNNIGCIEFQKSIRSPLVIFDQASIPDIWDTTLCLLHDVTDRCGIYAEAYEEAHSELQRMKEKILRLELIAEKTMTDSLAFHRIGIRPSVQEIEQYQADPATFKRYELSDAGSQEVNISSKPSLERSVAIRRPLVPKSTTSKAFAKVSDIDLS